jgi:hypothetical protein
MAAQVVETVFEIRPTAIIHHQNQTETSVTKMLRQIDKACFRPPGWEQHGNVGELRLSKHGFVHQTHRKTIEGYMAVERGTMPHRIGQSVQNLEKPVNDRFGGLFAFRTLELR